MTDTPFSAALHADDEFAESPDVAPPIRPATTFDRRGDHIYRRNSHETVQRLEAVLGALEGGHAVVYPSGMGSVAALLRYLRPARIALPDECYHGVRALVSEEARLGTWEVVEPDGLEAGDVRWLETPSNPTCRITDIAAVSAESAARGVAVIVDATFATPVLQDTLGLGANFAMHSTTKFIGGHSDAMGGVVVTGNEQVATSLRARRTRDGLVPGALETWLTLRGVRTLPLRIARQSKTAAVIASFLEGRVPAVHYPGLESDPGHEVAVRQMKAFGGVLSIDLREAEAAAQFVGRLSVFRDATSLGGVESLAEHRLLSDAHAPPGLVRLSIGLEEPDVLIGDLEAAL